MDAQQIQTKITEADKEYFRNSGFTEKHIEQIQKASGARMTKYSFIDNGQKISLKELLQIMDREEWLSGLGRSAFHFTSARQTRNGRSILFDSSNFFK